MSRLQPLSNAHDHLAIANTIARYCEALDTKDFALLETDVFVPDAEASYPFHESAFKGVGEVRGAIEKRLGPILTHHSLTTQRITISASSPLTARAVTYFIGAHFGQGPHEGKVLQAYGRYEDDLVCAEHSHSTKEGEGEDGVAGASGRWRIQKRVVGFTKRIGDEAIMREF